MNESLLEQGIEGLRCEISHLEDRIRSLRFALYNISVDKHYDDPLRAYVRTAIDYDNRKGRIFNEN